LKRFEEALNCYSEAKKQKPSDPQIEYFIGIMWGNMAEYQKALASFEEALRLKPDFSNALLAKGIVLSKLGKKEEAKQIADKLLETRSTPEKENSTESQSLNESIKNEFKAAQKRFNQKFSTPA
jgi:tetratricopeptide (TPR) repeat protein